MIDTSFLESITKFKIAMRNKTSMNMSGNRKSSQKGNSTEFSGFREYVHGDDPRKIDWNAYGRLNKLYIKEYMEEKESTVRILIDTSSSMDYGTKSKAELALKLALCFSYMAITNMDKVMLVDLKNPMHPYKCSGGKKSIPLLLNWLNKLEFNGDINLSEVCFSLDSYGSGVTILISDFLNEDIIDDASVIGKILRYFTYQKHSTNLVHILSSEELNVTLEGNLNLIDSENNTSLKVSMDNKSIINYEKRLNDFILSLKNEANKNGNNYGLIDTGLSFDQIIYEKLRFMYDF